MQFHGSLDDAAAQNPQLHDDPLRRPILRGIGHRAVLEGLPMRPQPDVEKMGAFFGWKKWVACVVTMDMVVSEKIFHISINNEYKITKKLQYTHQCGHQSLSQLKNGVTQL